MNYIILYDPGWSGASRRGEQLGNPLRGADLGHQTVRLRLSSYAAALVSGRWGQRDVLQISGSIQMDILCVYINVFIYVCTYLYMYINIFYICIYIHTYKYNVCIHVYVYTPEIYYILYKHIEFPFQKVLESVRYLHSYWPT